MYTHDDVLEIYGDVNVGVVHGNLHKTTYQKDKKNTRVGLGRISEVGLWACHVRCLWFTMSADIF
jgi:hypothetical protein